MTDSERDDGQPRDYRPRLVMLGFAVPDQVMEDICRTDRSPQVQTHKLSWAVIRGIEDGGTTIDLLSSPPISDYPGSKWFWSAYHRWNRGNGTDNRLIPFINVFGLKHVTRF